MFGCVPAHHRSAGRVDARLVTRGCLLKKKKTTNTHHLGHDVALLTKNTAIVRILRGNLARLIDRSGHDVAVLSPGSQNGKKKTRRAQVSSDGNTRGMSRGGNGEHHILNFNIGRACSVANGHEEQSSAKMAGRMGEEEATIFHYSVLQCDRGECVSVQSTAEISKLSFPNGCRLPRL